MRSGVDNIPQSKGGKLRRLTARLLDANITTASGRAIVEERYASLRRQVPIVYLLGFVNLAGMEMATAGRLTFGLNLPSFVAGCGFLRLAQWYVRTSPATHEDMVRRMAQTVLFAAIVCMAVCARCIHLLTTGDESAHMAIILFGGLTGIGVSYGLTALPAAGRIPLALIIVPVSVTALFSGNPQFAWAAFGLVVVAGLTMRLLSLHNLHLTDLIKSRSMIAHQQILAECAHQDAVIAATTDFLTGLPNRRAFVAAIDAAIAEGAKGAPFALGLLDLNRFKAVNDTFGHATGDKILQHVAASLLRKVGSRGLVARLGGDEFGILFRDVASVADARAAGAETLRAVNGPVTLGDRTFEIAACCGITLSTASNAPSPSRIMADADLALYEAKDDVATDVAIFERCMEAPRRRRLAIERALRTPGVEDNLTLAFQPIVDLTTRSVIAHEALARWTDGDLGAVSPSEFVPIAEQLNLIDRINNHLMQLAFKTARTWPETIKLSFNLSALQLCSAGFAETVLAKLAGAGLATSRLQAEVTETALLADFERARQNLDRLRQAGVTIVLDDFGAGYASIGYLRELRFDQIKLDGALVTAAKESADGRRLLGAVIGLCQLLGVSSVAEHIESEDILDLVMSLGCSAGQGFWLHRPVPAEALVGVDQLSKPAASPRRHLRAA